MNAPLPEKNRRPALPLLILHVAAAGVCFAFFSIIPITVCLVCMAIGNDPGGPMFFPIFVLGAVLGAAAITALLAGAAFLSDLLRRHYHVPLWLPPLVVFAAATGLCWLLFSSARATVPPLVGVFVAVTFIVHWALVSAVWFLPRLLF